MFDQGCAAAGIQPEIAFEAGAPGAAADLAARGLGVAVLSETSAAPHAERPAGPVIEDVAARAVPAVIWSRSMSPALRELLGHCRAEFENFGGGGEPDWSPALD